MCKKCIRTTTTASAGVYGHGDHEFDSKRRHKPTCQGIARIEKGANQGKLPTVVNITDISKRLVKELILKQNPLQ